MCTLFFFNNSFASVYNEWSAVCLKINGIILKSAKEERGLYKIELFNDKKIVDSSFVSVNKPFEFNLVKNLLYTIRVTKDGFIPLLIKIDTEINTENLTLYEFRFQTELRPSDKAKSENLYSDLLVGVLKFDKVKNRFYPIETIEAADDKTGKPIENAKAPNENSNMPVTCLKLNGLILKSPLEEKGLYKIELFLDNTIVDSKNISFNKPFEFSLAKNSWYTVRITKEGFVPLLISVDTKLAPENLATYEFNFETELYHKSSVNSIDKATYDLPIGLINYDASNNRFYPTNEYITHIQGAF